MPCQHGNGLEHDAAAEVFTAGIATGWLELLRLVELAVWCLVCVWISLKVLESPMIAIASAAVLLWRYRRPLLWAAWVVWMLPLCALEYFYGGCMYRATGDRSLPGFDAEIRYHPQEPKMPSVRPKPVQTAANGGNDPALAPAVAPGHLPPPEPSRKERLRRAREERLRTETAEERELFNFWRLDSLEEDMPGHPRLASSPPRQCQPTTTPPLSWDDIHQSQPPAASLPHLPASLCCAPLPKPQHPLNSGGLPAAVQSPSEWPEVMDICDWEDSGTALPPLAPNSTPLPVLAAPLPPQPALAPAFPAAPAPALAVPQAPVWVPGPPVPPAHVAPVSGGEAAAPAVRRPKAFAPARRTRRVRGLAPPTPPGRTPGPFAPPALAPAPVPLPKPTVQKRKDRASASRDPDHPAAPGPNRGPLVLTAQAPGPPRPTAPEPRGLAPLPLARRARAPAPSPPTPIKGPTPPPRPPAPPLQFAGECAAPGFGFGMGGGSIAPGFTFGEGVGPPAPTFGSEAAGPRARRTPGLSTLQSRASVPHKPAALEPKNLAPAPPLQFAGEIAAPGFGFGVRGASGSTLGAGLGPATSALGSRTARSTTRTPFGADGRRFPGAGGKAGGKKAANKRDHSCLEDSGLEDSGDDQPPACSNHRVVGRRIIEMNDDLILPELLDLDMDNSPKELPPMSTAAANYANPALSAEGGT